MLLSYLWILFFFEMNACVYHDSQHFGCGNKFPFQARILISQAPTWPFFQVTETTDQTWVTWYWVVLIRLEYTCNSTKCFQDTVLQWPASLQSLNWVEVLHIDEGRPDQQTMEVPKLNWQLESWSETLGYLDEEKTNCPNTNPSLLTTDPSQCVRPHTNYSPRSSPSNPPHTLEKTYLPQPWTRSVTTFSFNQLLDKPTIITHSHLQIIWYTNSWCEYCLKTKNKQKKETKTHPFAKCKLHQKTREKMITKLSKVSFDTIPLLEHWSTWIEIFCKQDIPKEINKQHIQKAQTLLLKAAIYWNRNKWLRQENLISETEQQPQNWVDAVQHFCD